MAGLDPAIYNTLKYRHFVMDGPVKPSHDS
jgi:hypothetical protein